VPALRFTASTAVKLSRQARYGVMAMQAVSWAEKRSRRLAAKAELRQALRGHASWQPLAASKVVRFTDQPDPFSGAVATQVSCSMPVSWH
jgi:hypothetical protein